MKRILLMISVLGVLLLSLSFVQKSKATDGVTCYKDVPPKCMTHTYKDTCPGGWQDEPCASSSPTPAHYGCGDNNTCQLLEGEGENTDSCNSENVDSDCSVSTPTPTPTPTPAPQVNTGGPGDGRSDGLGCGSNDCSGNKVGGGAVLGASTGPRVLGLSTTSGENEMLKLAQVLGSFVFSGLGLAFYKRSA